MGNTQTSNRCHILPNPDVEWGWVFFLVSSGPRRGLSFVRLVRGPLSCGDISTPRRDSDLSVLTEFSWLAQSAHSSNVWSMGVSLLLLAGWWKNETWLPENESTARISVCRLRFHGGLLLPGTASGYSRPTSVSHGAVWSGSSACWKMHKRYMRK